ncbi:MAG: septum formation initiator family protein [Ruminococcaceae bacterium]|nr:septum formation initiator family protein [Oscillospiraceae bacterium]
MKRKPKKNKSIILRLFIVFVCGYMVFTLLGLWGTLNQSYKELSALKEEYQTQQNSIEELRTLLEYESDSKLIEKAARERLGYIYSDEQVFIDISGN